MKRLFVTLLLTLTLVTPAFAQQEAAPTDTPTPTPPSAAVATPTPPDLTTPSPTPPSSAGPGGGPAAPHDGLINCDACGYCKGMTLEQVPSRWQNCRRCLYLGTNTGDLNPLDNVTLKKSQDIIPQPDMFHMYTDFGCISTKPEEFVGQVSTFFFSLVGGIAFLFFLYGAGIVATSRSDPQRLNKGRRVIFGSIAGLLFALFAVFVMRFIASTLGAPNLGG